MPFSKLILAGALAVLAVPAAAAQPAEPGQQQDGVPAIAPPPPGMGQVVFYRSSRMGMAISCRVREGDQIVNRLPPGRYFVQQTTPGVHEYMVRSEARDVLRLEVEDGETYYVRCAIGMGIGMGRPNLSLQNAEDFQRRGRGLDLQPAFTGDDD